MAPIQAPQIADAGTSRWRVAEWLAFAFTVAALLYFGLWFRPVAPAKEVASPTIGMRDRFFGLDVRSATMWLVGAGGRVVRSDDAGKSWHRQSSGVSVNLQDIASWDTQRAVAVGNRGIVLSTADGGASWQAGAITAPRVANKFMRVVAGANGEGWLVGESGSIYRTLDHGRQWSRVAPEADQRWYGVAATGSGGAVVVGEFGHIQRTVDGGSTWLKVASPLKSSLTAVAFADSTQGVAVGLEGKALRTVDGGANWTEVVTGTPRHLFDVQFGRGGYAAVGNFVRLRGTKDGSAWQAMVAPRERAGWFTEIGLAPQQETEVAVGEFAAVWRSGAAGMLGMEGGLR